MEIGKIEGATHNLGAPENWDESRNGTCGVLPCKCVIEADQLPRWVSAWIPSPEDIEKIVAGAPITLSVVGYAHPPVWVDVGDVPAKG